MEDIDLTEQGDQENAFPVVMILLFKAMADNRPSPKKEEKPPEEGQNKPRHYERPLWEDSQGYLGEAYFPG
jgi:hypothetical protein